VNTSMGKITRQSWASSYEETSPKISA
jgi:hypothetical protein